MRIVFSIILAVMLAAPSFALAETNVSVNINMGAPRVFFDSPPLFLSPSPLGFYVGVDMSHDLVLISGVYYLFQGNGWYRADHYNGPWTVVRYEQLPYQVRQHKVEKIRYYRDNEYRDYHNNRDHYRGRNYRPEKQYKQQFKEEKRWEKEDRRPNDKKRRRGDD